MSLVTSSPLAAFAIAAGYQIVMFTVRIPVYIAYERYTYWTRQAYIAAYLLTLTYAKTSEADSIITIIRMWKPVTAIPVYLPLSDFTLSLAAPVASIVRTRRAMT